MEMCERDFSLSNVKYVTCNVQSGQRFQVADAILMNHLDFIRFQIQFRCFGWNSAWNFFEFVSGASHDGASACA